MSNTWSTTELCIRCNYQIIWVLSSALVHMLLQVGLICLTWSTYPFQKVFKQGLPLQVKNTRSCREDYLPITLSKYTNASEIARAGLIHQCIRDCSAQDWYTNASEIAACRTDTPMHQRLQRAGLIHQCIRDCNTPGLLYLIGYNTWLIPTLNWLQCIGDSSVLLTGKEKPILIPTRAENRTKTLFFSTYWEKTAVLFPITLWQKLCEENFWKKNLVTKTLWQKPCNKNFERNF